MKTLVKILVVLVLLAAGAYFAYPRVMAYWKARHRVTYREAEVTRGEIISVVNATGTVQPVRRVQIGSFVSGPIVELKVDFNTSVKKGDLLAKIDPRLYEANVARDRAALATRKAEVARAEAQLEQATNDEKRAQSLRAENSNFISEAELDQLKFNRRALEALLEVAKAEVLQAQASLENSQANLGYTNIVAPVDGVVIDRKVDQGQTVAASFQTPELFTIAPEMEKKMHVFASVDEADIGLVREAKRRNERVQFTVDAYPDDLFEGQVYQIRINPTTTQNVVTYPVVVEAPNPDLKLLPGMTANLSFQIEKHENVLRIPNAALRFYPASEQVRPEDRKLLEGAEDKAPEEGSLSASDKVKAKQERDRRHVWVVEGDFLRAIPVVVGLSDNKYTELVQGALEVGRKLVTAVGSEK